MRNYAGVLFYVYSIAPKVYWAASIYYIDFSCSIAYFLIREQYLQRNVNHPDNLFRLNINSEEF